MRRRERRFRVRLDARENVPSWSAGTHDECKTSTSENAWIRVGCGSRRLKYRFHDVAAEADVCQHRNQYVRAQRPLPAHSSVQTDRYDRR